MSSGAVSMAPRVSAARSAIPSIAAESNGGDDRVAQIGAAVTRPTAWSSATVTAGRREGHPLSARQRAHSARARARGTSRRNGVVRSAIAKHLDELSGRQAVGVLGDDDIAVGGGEDRQQRRGTEDRLDLLPVHPNLDDVEPARGRRQIAGETARGGRVAVVGGPATGAADQRHAEEPEHDKRRSWIAGEPDDRDAAAVGQERRLARLDRQAVAPDLRAGQRRDGGGGLVATAHRRAGTDDDHVAARQRLAQRVEEGTAVIADDPWRLGPAAGLAHQGADGDAERVADLSRRDGRSVGRDELVTGGQDGDLGPAMDSDPGDAQRGQHGDVLRADRHSGGYRHGAGSDVLVAAHDPLSGGYGSDHLDGPR